jgi:putative FmdB family regulatory protein
MPIYAYKCSACGHAKDVLQKISDDPLTVCPACGAAAFSKQITAAGFQLKGAGWYVTDFRSGGDGANSGVAKPADAGKSDAAASPAPSAAAPAPAVATAAPATAVVAKSTPSAPKSVASSPASTPASS